MPAGSLAQGAILIATLVFWLTSAATGQPFDWPPLDPISSVRNVEFKEERWLNFLTEPVVSIGILSLSPDGGLSKTVLNPIQERMTVAGEQIIVERPPGRQVAQIALRRSRAIGALVEAVRSLASANRARLEASFDITLTGSSAEWIMRLVPKPSADHGTVVGVVVWGALGNILKMEIAESDGSRSILEFLH